MKYINIALVIAIFVTFVYSHGGGPKLIIPEGPGSGPWPIGSEQIASWHSAGFTVDVFSADKMILAYIDDQFKI
ncbi:516_t:CDS:2, partial [Funneliformis geosporum]